MFGHIQSDHQSRKNILIIDDCHVTREALRAILKNNYKIFLAETAWEGLNLIFDDIGLIFLDLILPDLNGLEVLKQIKKEYPAIPVVVITSFGTEERCTKAFRLGARDYIKKPFKTEEILQKTELFLSFSPTQRRNLISMSTNDIVIDNRCEDIPSDILNSVLEVKDYIDKNLKLSLNLSDACKMAGMNRTYFSKYFRLLIGQSFQDYLSTIKLKRARALLRSRTLRVSDIAELLGFNTKHFSETFKRTFGVSPKDLRD